MDIRSYLHVKDKNLTIGIFLFAVILFFFVQYAHVFAGLTHSARGFAWSGATDGSPSSYRGMGWISMNNVSDGSGGDYGVQIPPADGNITGYAWSGMTDANGQPGAYYGWISFRGADLAGCPAGANQQARRVGNTIQGGARILAIRDAVASGNAGGYDGCISLSGITISGNQLSGYAWSGDLGWIDFSGVSIQNPPQCSDGIDNDGDGKIDFGAGPANDPGCTGPNDDDETDGGATPPDLTVVNTVPAANQTFNDPVSITFTGTITVNNAAMLPGEQLWGDVEIDWNQPNCAAAAADAVQNAGGPWQNLAMGATQGMTATLQASLSQLQNGTHCYRMIADRGNLVTETDDTNNAGPWQTFTVSNLPECSDGIDNADPEDTAVDMSDPGCTDPSDTDETNGGGCPPQVIGNCSLDATTLNTPSAGSCTNGTRGTCTYTCNTVTGNWTPSGSGNQCYAGDITASPTSGLPGMTSVISWQVQPSTNCWVEGSTAVGSVIDSWNNIPSDNTDPREDETTSSLTEDTTYTLACGTPGNLLDNVTIDVAGPDIDANPRTVKEGENTTINWDTKGRLDCEVRGGGVTITPAPVIGNQDVTINARTSFTLTCPGFPSDTVTVNVLPRGFET